MWSSIQPLPGRLQQRVVQEQQAATAGLEHPGHLVDRGLDRVDVLDHQAHHHRVEGARRGTGAFGGGLAVARDLRRARRATRDLVAGRVDADDRRRRGRRPAARPGLRRSRRRARGGRRRGGWSTSGRICSSYSGSAPSVNSSCHHSACRSHSGSSPVIGPFWRRRAPDRGTGEEPAAPRRGRAGVAATLRTVHSRIDQSAVIDVGRRDLDAAVQTASAVPTARPTSRPTASTVRSRCQRVKSPAGRR